jgi:hypothetical protein
VSSAVAASAAADSTAVAADATAPASVTVRIARTWMPLFKLMKSGRAQVQLAASYINFLQRSDDDAFSRLLQECKAAAVVAVIVKSIVSGGLKSDSLAEEVGIMLLMRTLSGLAPEHAQHLFPRGGASKIIKKLAGNLKTGRVIGSAKGWSLSLDLLHCFASCPFALEALNKLIYVPAAKGSSSSKRAAARVVLELYCSVRSRQQPPPPIPLPTLMIYAQVAPLVVAFSPCAIPPLQALRTHHLCHTSYHHPTHAPYR